MSDGAFEREQEDYFRRVRGVGEWNSVYSSSTSRYNWDGASWHPAMLRGRSGRTGAGSLQREAIRILGFLLLVLGIPALVIAIVASRPSAGTLVVILSNLTGAVMVAALLLAYAKVRARRRAYALHQHGHHRPHRHG